MYVCFMQEVLIKLKFMELIKTLEHKDLFKQASKAIKVKTTNTIILNPVFVHALELKLEKFSELKRAMEQLCLEIHDLNLNRACLHKRIQIQHFGFAAECLQTAIACFMQFKTSFNEFIQLKSTVTVNCEQTQLLILKLTHFL